MGGCAYACVMCAVCHCLHTGLQVNVHVGESNGSLLQSLPYCRAQERAVCPHMFTHMYIYTHVVSELSMLFVIKVENSSG